MSLKHSIIASSLMLMTFFFTLYATQAEDIKPNRPFSTFPKQIGDWIGDESRFNDAIYKKLGVDDSFLATFHKNDQSHVQLYIGFYQSQKEGDIIHSPRNCMPGAGWKITESSIKEISVHADSNRKRKVIFLTLQKSAEKQLMYYWFQSRGRIISSEYMQKIYLVIDSILRHRTDGSFVRLIAPVMNNNIERTEENLEDFVKVLFPVLHEYLPS